MSWPLPGPASLPLQVDLKLQNLVSKVEGIESSVQRLENLFANVMKAQLLPNRRSSRLNSDSASVTSTTSDKARGERPVLPRLALDEMQTAPTHRYRARREFRRRSHTPPEDRWASVAPLCPRSVALLGAGLVRPR